jgi:hypothetical protein
MENIKNINNNSLILVTLPKERVLSITKNLINTNVSAAIAPFYPLKMPVPTVRDILDTFIAAVKVYVKTANTKQPVAAKKPNLRK